MKRLSLVILIFYIFSQSSSCQKNKSDSIEKYAYPFYLFHGTANDADFEKATGFFIKISSHSFFVTAKHCFYEQEKMDLRGVKQIRIFIQPDKIDGANILIDMSTKELIPACFHWGCADIVMFPIFGEKEFPYKINYVNYTTEENDTDTLSGTLVYIIGYPHDALKIVKTKIFRWDLRSPFFYTEESSDFGASGCPAFIYSKNDNNNNIPTLIGIYSGKDTAGDYRNKGFIQKADILRGLVREIKRKNGWF